MEEINLLQNRIKDSTFAWEKQGRIVIGFLSLVLILILGSSVLLYLLNNSVMSELETANRKVSDLQRQLDQKQESLNEVKVFQAQLSNIKTLLASHTALSPLLNELSSATYRNVRFASLDMNEETGKVHIEGSAPTYADIGKLMLALHTSEKFTSVKLLTILPSTGETTNYQFAIDVVAAPDLFAK